METRLENYSYTFNNVEKINFKQIDLEIPVDAIIEGKWKLYIICVKNLITGMYFYNIDYVSQVYGDAPLRVKKGGLNVILNDNKTIGKKITEINGLKICKNGFSFDNESNMFVSTFMNKLCGFLIICK